MNKIVAILAKHILFACLLAPTLIVNAQTDIKTEKIWDKAPHNAFTDLIRYKNRFYCTFREAISHYSTQGKSNGKIRVIVSKDGKTWESFALLERDSFDLRDPNFSITSDGRLMLVTGIAQYSNGAILSRHTHASFLDDATNKFSDPVPVQYNDEVLEHSDNAVMNWLWRVIWHNGRAYGVIYEEFDRNGKPLTQNRLNLVSSADGIHYELVKSFEITGKPDETALRFGPGGDLYILVRMESPAPDHTGLLGRSTYPYKDWEMINTGVKLGGPNLVFTPEGNILVGTRTYSPGSMHTALFGTDANGKFKELIEFPSDGDCSYPGMVIYNNTLYFSYYSSHEQGKSNIYFSRIPLRTIKKLGGEKPASPFKK